MAVVTCTNAELSLFKYIASQDYRTDSWHLPLDFGL